MMKVYDSLITGQLLKQGHKAISIFKGTQWAKINEYIARSKALTNNLNVFCIASIQVAVLQFADLFQCLEACNALFKFDVERSFRGRWAGSGA